MSLAVLAFPHDGLVLFFFARLSSSSQLAMVSIHALPAELVRSIINVVETQQDLFNLTLVSFFHSYSQERLYARPAIATLDRAKQFHNTVTSSRVIASRVKAIMAGTGALEEKVQ